MEIEESTPYTHAQVLNIINTFKATTSDYLILTYFKIFKITQGPLYEKYKRRFSNLIINNLPQITTDLTRRIFVSKAIQLLLHDLANVSYLSCIYPKKDGALIVVQYFNPSTGLEHAALLHPAITPEQVIVVFRRFHLINKIVGFCGSYCHRDSSFKYMNNISTIATVLQTSSRNRVLDLPYCDDFIIRLFDIIFDNFPDDVLKGVKKLGETLQCLNLPDAEIANNLSAKYKAWSKSSEHILLSDYVQYIVTHYTGICQYLQIFQNLPKCVNTLFNSVSNRFLLLFAKEIYIKYGKFKLSDNNAVVYYFYLVRLKEKFETYDRNNYVPTKAWNYLSAQLNRLIANKEYDSDEEDTKIHDLEVNVMKVVNKSYQRAIQYIEPLLLQFENFETYAWVLLDANSSIKFEQVHGTFHLLTNSACDNCDNLQQEVRVLNAARVKVPLLDVDSVVSRWVILLKECLDEVPIVLKLLKYLLCLPASYVVHDEVWKAEKDFEYCEKFVRVNLRRFKEEDVVEKIEEFFETEMDSATRIVTKGRIERLED